MAQYAKFIDKHTLDYARMSEMVFDNVIYKPVPVSVLVANGYKEVVTQPTPSTELEKDHHWESKWSNTAEAIVQVWYQVEDDTTPPQRRQNAYATRPMIEFGNDIITVDEARNICGEYMYDGTEKAAQIIAELSAKIAAAKEAIREEYPDNEEPEEAPEEVE